jgi:hypothetical protein
MAWLISVAVMAAAAATIVVGPQSEAQAAGLTVRIAGNHFVDGAGRTVRLLGVNRSGTEYECMANNGFFDGPADAASIAAMASWNIDAVRVPLNEDCWLGINGAPPRYSGANYRNAIAGYVSRLHAAGMYAIVDLHWNAQGALPADGRTGQGREMADLDHAPSADCASQDGKQGARLGHDNRDAVALAVGLHLCQQRIRFGHQPGQILLDSRRQNHRHRAGT